MGITSAVNKNIKSSKCKLNLCACSYLRSKCILYFNDFTSGVNAVTMFACRKYLLNDGTSSVVLYAYGQSELYYSFTIFLVQLPSL